MFKFGYIKNVEDQILYQNKNLLLEFLKYVITDKIFKVVASL
ncbi:hypothetical protein SAMN04487987_1123 [Algibacter pectinivorans]|uniref:Uncharacterized protein n=1 Tax=Algibacter pectinivorans TaxID=870482 RepID=A0A1I1RY64_9FLAO|nr:hypothetical protein SAMN04487987_1123 [Algibacter pectinivorans]